MEFYLFKNFKINPWDFFVTLRLPRYCQKLMPALLENRGLVSTLESYGNQGRIQGSLSGGKEAVQKEYRPLPSSSLEVK